MPKAKQVRHKLTEAETIKKLKKIINEVIVIDTPTRTLDRRITAAYKHLLYVHNALHRY